MGTNIPTKNPTAAPTFVRTTSSGKTHCCAWGGVCTNKNPNSWCNKKKKNCEKHCNGEYIDPNAPKPEPNGCCSWNGKCQPGNTWCNRAQEKCEGPCNGVWKISKKN